MTTPPLVSTLPRELVLAPAIRFQCGRVFVADTHWDAVVDAQAAGFAEDALPTAEDGFVTSRERFVGRDEAFELAERADQVSMAVLRSKKGIPESEPMFLNAEDLPL
jgi:hypothetical protein